MPLFEPRWSLRSAQGLRWWTRCCGPELVGAKREELMLLLKESLASCIGRDPRDGRRGLHR